MDFRGRSRTSHKPNSFHFKSVAAPFFKAAAVAQGRWLRWLTENATTAVCGEANARVKTARVAFARDVMWGWTIAAVCVRARIQ